MTNTGEKTYITGNQRNIQINIFLLHWQKFPSELLYFRLAPL